MRNSNEQSLSEVIRELLDAYRLKDGLTQVRIREAFNALMDPAIISRISDLNYKKGKLVILSRSAVLTHELQFQKDEIKNALNTVLKEELISTVEIR